MNGQTRPDWTASLEDLARTPVVTLVGANERGGATRLLLDRLEDPACRFSGRVNLVNRRSGSVFGHSAVPAVEAIDGEPGLAWLLVPQDQVMPTLRSFPRPPRGVVVYAAGYREAGNEDAERELRDWAFASAVPVFGPQSVGVAWFGRGLNALDIAVKYPVQSGSTAVLAQSGGMLTAIVAALLRNGIGLHSAFAMGNEAVLDICDVARAALADPACRTIAMYFESVLSLRDFAQLAEEAAACGKPLVLLKGGRSELGSSLAASHTGALASPARLVEGIAEQFGVVLVRSVEQMVSSLKALSARGAAPCGAGSIGVFSNYGGGNVVFCDALEEAGLRLADASPGTRRALFGDRVDVVANPYDASGGLMGRPDEFARRVDAFTGEPAFDIVVHVLAQLPDAAHGAHMFRFDEFVRACARNKKLPFAAILIDEPAGSFGERSDFMLGLGLDDAVSRLKALQRWSAAQALGPWAGWAAVAPPLTSKGPIRVATGHEARDILGALPLSWPAEMTVEPGDDLGSRLAALQFPLVAKAEAGLAHRAAEGAVITHIPNIDAAGDILSFFRKRFGTPVTFSEFVPHETEFFFGLLRSADGLAVLAMGPGGHLVESATSFRILPLTRRQTAACVETALPSLSGREDVIDLLDALQTVAARPGVEAVDLNPVVVAPDGRLTVLDAKIHLRGPD